MSQIRYASITPSLLARKGDAAPSLEMLPRRPSVFAAPETEDDEADPAPATAPRTAAAGGVPPDGERRRRIVLMLSSEEYERLGIAAAKAESTRHQVLRQAMQSHLARIASERRCACLSGGPCCG